MFCPLFIPSPSYDFVYIMLLLECLSSRLSRNKKKKKKPGLSFPDLFMFVLSAFRTVKSDEKNLVKKKKVKQQQQQNNNNNNELLQRLTDELAVGAVPFLVNLFLSFSFPFTYIFMLSISIFSSFTGFLITLFPSQRWPSVSLFYCLLTPSLSLIDLSFSSRRIRPSHQQLYLCWVS
uniref:Uncharacterized protein n=1 Tax=Trypanosoma vivax (strain Y486) TaxID=1055687 RepID=G0TW08_TRYVY|nr:hypothetical protein, unlikely [Trypanosoma vivax Y486]